MKAKDRKKQLLISAVQACEKYGYHNFNRDHIAEFSGASATLITVYFPTVTQLKRAIVRYSIKNEVLPVIAQALAVGDKQALKCNDELKIKALQTIS